jgi:mono/diheme cytochrome c family protein
MGKHSWFLAGVASVAVVVVILAYVTLSQSNSFSTKATPTALERWIAGTARSLTISSAAKLANPVPESAEALDEGREHWADHCASCHANNGSGDTELGKHLYPPAPDMRLPATQDKSDGELFFIIQNGIRMSGMPGWGSAGHEEESWKLVRFIRHLPHVSGQEELDMRKLNPKSPAEIEEEQEENNFLNGAKPNASTHHHH